MSHPPAVQAPTSPAASAEVSPAAGEARARVVRQLLDARRAAGHWEGELSNSALSTATAIFALSEFRRSVAATSVDVANRHDRLIKDGVSWLVRHQNADGGWGDTTRSFSNISTTALCWAALSVADGGASAAVSAAEAWLARAAGSLEPRRLADAIIARYGNDRTFSVPILTMCALAGRLGDPSTAWRRVPQLPFELAAIPQAWFRFVRLPVVSYALPALISIGLLRHRKRPTRNPITRALRHATTPRTLCTLAAVQPANGGFLEAAPLTSFVTMSLIGAGLGEHPVVSLGIDFLVRSARPDGSWPIDTNLATWVTTLSINALAAGGGPTGVAEQLATSERRSLREWLIGQQYRDRHPYTGAAPGGWAWTDLPGGVPDADDTAGALLALHNLGEVDDRVRRAATAGITWLLDLQNGDGGVPTFCRGWTNLPFDRSGPDLTAHALLAWCAWLPVLPPDLARRVRRATAAAIRYLSRVQRPDGSWLPLWFGNQHVHDDENPCYGTARVLIGLARVAEAARADGSAVTDVITSMMRNGIRWLLRTQRSDGGFGGSFKVVASVEETALAATALAAVCAGGEVLTPELLATATEAHRLATDWLVRSLQFSTPPPPEPIGLYFAKLWYFESLYPTVFAAAALSHSRA